MKTKVFEDEYNRIIDWLLRSICDGFKNMSEEEGVYAIKYCYDFKKNLMKKYTKFIDEDASASCHCTELMMNFNQLYGFAKNYMINAKKTKHDTAAEAIFMICQNLRYEFPKEVAKLQNTKTYIRPITAEYASKHVNSGIKPVGMLTYRKLNLPVYYDENSSSFWVKISDSFSTTLEWDWYYNIDSYLDIHYDEKIEPINYEAYLASSLPA
jgi:hypothetical protein